MKLAALVAHGDECELLVEACAAPRERRALGGGLAAVRDPAQARRFPRRA